MNSDQWCAAFLMFAYGLLGFVFSTYNSLLEGFYGSVTAIGMIVSLYKSKEGEK